MPRWKFGWFLIVVFCCAWPFVTGDLIINYQSLVIGGGYSTNQWLDVFSMMGELMGIISLYIGYQYLTVVPEAEEDWNPRLEAWLWVNKHDVERGTGTDSPTDREEAGSE